MSSSSKNILFSVIIPTYHRNQSLAQCLDCIAPGVQTFSANFYEVIVSDDGTQSNAQEMIQQRYPWVKWVYSGKGSPAANRNNGAKCAQGEWLIFTDDDCLPEPEWLEAYAKTISNSALAMEGAIHPQGNLQQDLAECPVNTSGGCFWSANIAIQRCLFNQVGGFDANYPLAAFEDQDLKIRLEQRTKIIFVATAVVKHPVRVLSLSKALNRLPRLCIAYAYHLNKNRQYLGYENTFVLGFSQYRFHLQSLLKHLKSRAFNSSLSSLAMLIFGVPLVLLNLRD